ncbi:MAG TPA: acyl-CoA dehydrogenase family protein [Thermoleophilaceae bacterium]|jgi:putative acyl-CoA dehydrogenase|nr:acyl-CoA dehydrogenase family protein [Thermoleophilaceae bacterium]
MHTQTRSPSSTHEVTNQPPPFEGENLFELDLALQEGLTREGGAWGIDRARDLGAVAGSAEAIAHGRRANTNLPVLRTHDRYGHRVDQVELDPSWHWLLRIGVEREIPSLPWRDPKPGAHVTRGTLFMLWSQVEAGVMCPISMTYAAVPALRKNPDLAAEWEPRLTLPDYERGSLSGMAMTEKQGGSDVRANSTQAVPIGDGAYELTGHKWFCSYPPCDVFLILAQAPGGLSCFLLPRGPGMEFQRLKDKLGTRSLPSSEVEFRGAVARLIGEEGRGVPTIIEMVNHTRLDCLLGSATGMRRGFVEAAWHAKHRSAFGKLLVDQPAMQNVLADMALESEAATTAALRAARAYDEQDHAFKRIATAVLKYWVCKRAPGHAAEALECLGGNGFVEESLMPRLYRDAPLNSIWEGSGNVAALDVLRALAKEPEALPAFMAEVEPAAGANPHLDAHVTALKARFAGFGESDPQWQARRVVEDMGLALQASLLVRNAPAFVADAFCASRLGRDGLRATTYGTLPAGVDAKAIIDRALPV